MTPQISNQISTVIDFGTLVQQTPGTVGGAPRLAGTRITIRSLAIDYNKGQSAEDIAQNQPHLSLAQIYIGLAYYFVHQNEIDAEIRLYYEEADQLEAEFLTHASQTL